jgi:hypothetical protein
MRIRGDFGLPRGEATGNPFACIERHSLLDGLNVCRQRCGRRIIKFPMRGGCSTPDISLCSPTLARFTAALEASVISRPLRDDNVFYLSTGTSLKPNFSACRVK